MSIKYRERQLAWMAHALAEVLAERPRHFTLWSDPMPARPLRIEERPRGLLLLTAPLGDDWAIATPRGLVLSQAWPQVEVLDDGWPIFWRIVDVQGHGDLQGGWDDLEIVLADADGGVIRRLGRGATVSLSMRGMIRFVA